MLKPICLILIFILLFGCTQSEKSTKSIIAVSNYPIYDFTKNIVDENDFEVWLMLPPKLNAHAYEPTPQDIIKLEKAEVFIYSNDYFEFWAKKTAQSTNNKNLIVIVSSNTIKMIPPDDESLGPLDPHTWLSPKNAYLQVRYIADELIVKYPNKKDKIEAKTNLYLKKLEELDKKFVDTTSKCIHREMFVSHAAFGYLAKQYNLTQIPIVKNFDPQGEVSISDLSHVIEEAKKLNATHIFFEDFISPKMSEAVAREINGKTAIFSPMEAYSLDQLNSGSYIQVMSDNLKTLEEALVCG